MSKAIWLILLLVLLPVAHAQETDTTSAGVTPDSTLYGLDKAFERIGLALAAGKIGKAEKRLDRASERIAELAAMIDKGNSQYTAELLNEYRSELDQAEEDILTAKDAGQNVEKAEKDIARATYNSVIVLERVLANAPAAAQDGLKNAITQSTKNNQRALSRLERATGKAAGIPEDLAMRRKGGKP